MCDRKDDRCLRDDVEELSASDESEPEESLTAVISDPELDHRDENEDEDPCDEAALAQFSLKGGGSAFSYRTRNIFDCLDKVAPQSSSSSCTLKQQAPSRKTSRPPPSSPIAAKRKGTPDYLLHPERWTHYSLEGVSETSEQGNAEAAFNFLSELQERKKEQKRSQGEQHDEEEQEEKKSNFSSCEPKHRMVFCLPNRQKKETAAAAERSREKETHLSHLQEEQEEEEKRTESGTERETGKGVEEGVKEAPPVFTFRKMRSKNYRRSSEGEEV